MFNGFSNRFFSWCKTPPISWFHSILIRLHQHVRLGYEPCRAVHYRSGIYFWTHWNDRQSRQLWHWKCEKFDIFYPSGQLDSIAPSTRSNPTARWRRKHLGFCKRVISKGPTVFDVLRIILTPRVVFCFVNNNCRCVLTVFFGDFRVQSWATLDRPTRSSIPSIWGQGGPAAAFSGGAQPAQGGPRSAVGPAPRSGPAAAVGHAAASFRLPRTPIRRREVWESVA